MRTVKLTKLVEDLNLKVVTPDVDMTDIKLSVPDITTILRGNVWK